MDWKLELIVVPVSDVDRAKDFYGGQCGFKVDVDQSFSDVFRVVQLTPPGSACSIAIGKGLGDAVPGSIQGLQVVVTDIEAARSQLAERGVAITPVRHLENGAWVDGPGNGPYESFCFFNDPDGNGWALQERP